MRPRLTAIAPSLAGVVRSAGGWLFDQAMAGWDVTVITADQADPRPAHRSPWSTSCAAGAVAPE